ncbi:MAG: two component, sigma54 specific, transcriptional regulator, Fis family [Acidobacteriales bacterium]|nr:two component, sigma54 specific, transcriptional regulator, Fis family [Terriglobales bacterium]
MPRNRTVLVIDDEPSMLRYMRTLLELDSFDVETASNGAEGISRIEKGPVPDLVFLDLLMPGMDGLEALDRMRKIRSDLKVVIISCVSDTAKVVQAIRSGAQDYLTKPFEKHQLDHVLERCIEPESGKTELVCEVEDLDGGGFFLAATVAMKKIRSEVGLVANVDIPVLILGESGTGKEIIARLIHQTSGRKTRPFMKVNCAALPADLLESELFGYDSGAFTGANKAKPGKFELCNKGTLLLDEIGEMPPHLQAKLLHVLQDGEFSRLGSRASIKVDVRVLAATNIDVQKSIENKTFREDLYYRLNAFTLNVPPLRERREEIPQLLRHMMSRMSEDYGRSPLPMTPKFIEACSQAPWPGNVRELGNFMKRYLILADENLAIAELAKQLETESPKSPAKAAAAAAGADTSDLKTMVRGLKDGAEMEAITRTLIQTGWNRKRAAEILNISYKAMLNKVRQYGIKPPRSSALHFADKDAS